MSVLTYTEYHNQSRQAGDIDPGVTCLNYLSNRFELTMEQRYWLAFLYGTCYCAPTVFFIYNEFPDYIGTDVNRLSRWWAKYKQDLVFQTDRQRIRSNDQFIDCFKSYRSLVKTHQGAYFRGRTAQDIYAKVSQIKYFGRFSLFNYLQVLNKLTDVTAKPAYLNMMEAESCRNGVAFAIGRDDLVEQKLTKNTAQLLHNAFVDLLRTHDGDIFDIETTLCAYKKYRWGKRYVGYYIDRMDKELEHYEKRGHLGGVAWETLRQFRIETFEHQYLTECYTK